MVMMKMRPLKKFLQWKYPPPPPPPPPPPHHHLENNDHRHVCHHPRPHPHRQRIQNRN